MKELLFFVIKEFRQTASMSGKVWQIKVLSGLLHVGQTICFFGVKVIDNQEASIVRAVVKDIRQDVGLESKKIDMATEGDIVSIDIRDCYFNDKKIKKNDISSTKVTWGGDETVRCYFAKQITLTMDNKNLLVEKLCNSIGKSHNGYEVSLLWFGKGVPISLRSVDFSSPNTSDFTFNVDTMPIPIPTKSALCDVVRYAVIKDRQLVQQNGRYQADIYRWIYCRGMMVFKNKNFGNIKSNSGILT